MKTVIILGAGASRSAGAPLMSDFLDIAYENWKLGKLSSDDADSFKRVYKGISALQFVHSKSQMEITNVENVFSAFEMGVTLRSFPQHSIEDINKLPYSIKKLIVSTLQDTIKYPVKNNSITPTQDYLKFSKVVSEISSKNYNDPLLSILTFNYDIALDFALYNQGVQFDYNLTKNNSNNLSLLKLHGSVNWSTCSKCNNVIPVTFEEYFSKYSYRHLYDAKEVKIDITSALNEFQHCSENLNVAPVLIPPTWNKQEYHRSISNVWANAAEKLKEAENIFIIGYSLPESDSFFKYLFALGTAGEFPLKRLWVFNPDSSGNTEKRYREILGPGAEVRFDYKIVNFDAATEIIRKTLLVK